MPGKAQFACDVRAAQDPAGKEKWLALGRQIAEGKDEPRPMSGPDWYLPAIHEPGWYDFPIGPWAEADDDSR